MKINKINNYIFLIVLALTQQIVSQALSSETGPDSDPPYTTLDINGYYPLSGNSRIDVQSYELHISDIDYIAETISASAVISIKAVSNLTTETGICLDFAPPGGDTNSIISLTVAGSPCPFSLETYASGSTDNFETYLKIIPPATITEGTVFVIDLVWSGHPNEESTSFGNGWGMDFLSSPEVVATMNQPNSAHLWFPCNDKPEDKAACDIYGTVDLDQWAISVGELVSVTTNGSERTFHWHTDFNVAPYLIAFNAGDYTHVPDVGGASVPVEAWYYDGSYAAWQAGAENARNFLNTYTNIYGAYPFEKYAHVQFWNTGAAYMEHQTISSMKDNSVQYTAHELSHQWWGDFVTCETWNDLWLNEGFAVYSEYLRNRGKTGRDEIASEMPARTNLNWNDKLNGPGYNSIGDLFSFSLVYNRGAWMIHHIRNFLGENKFWSAILHYKAEHGNEKADTEDFRNCLAESAFDNQTDQECFKSFFDRYLEDSKPELNVNWYARTLNGNTYIFMYNKRTDGFDCGDVIVSQVDFDDSTAQTVFHRFITNENASVVIVSNKTFSSISIDEHGDFPCLSTSDLSVSGGGSETDSDGDSLPDQWELATLGTLSSGANDDPDGDGLDNAAEYATGTLPGTFTTGTTPPVSTTVFYHDDFGGNLTGWDDGTDWEGDLTVSVNNNINPLVYSNGYVYVNGGDSAISITDNVSGTQSHYYRRTIETQTNTFYMSFLARFNTSPGSWNYLALGQKVSGNDSGAALGQVGSSSAVGAAFIDDGASIQPLGSSIIAGKTYFIVVKYIWDQAESGFSGLTAYLNPTSIVQESAEDEVSLTGSIQIPDIDSVDFQYYGSANADFDEIRAGTSWTSVVPSGIVPSLEVSANTNIIEIGGTAEVSVSLSSQPAYNVTVTISTDSLQTNLYASVESLTFTPENWDQPQCVIIHSLDNGDAPESTQFTFTPDTKAISAVTHVFSENMEDASGITTLTINLHPQDAITSGAQWGLVSGNTTNWYDGGTSVSTVTGSYEIVYTPVFQSVAPQPETIFLANSLVTLDRSYSQAEAFEWRAGPAVDISENGSSLIVGSGKGLLESYFGVHPLLQTVENARTNGNISITSQADLIGSLDRSNRPQDQTWVFDWKSLKPTLHTNTVDWGECDWIGLHTPSIAFDLSNGYYSDGDDHPYESCVEHLGADGQDSTHDYYPSGGEFYDMEGIYFNNDNDYFYLAVICSVPFSNEWTNAAGMTCRDLGISETASTRTNTVVIPGDIAFDFGLNTPVSERSGSTFSYDFGIDLTHEVRDQSRWMTISHTYFTSSTSTGSFSYERPPVRNLDMGTGLYRTANSDWFLALDENAAIAAGGERSNFDPEDSASAADYRGDVQSSVYRLDFPDGNLENDLPTYVYEFVIPRSLFGGCETNMPYIKVRYLPTSCRNDGNDEEHVFYLSNAEVTENVAHGALGNRVWFDRNHNGIQDDSENTDGLADVQVVAVSLDTGTAYTNRTDESGFYLFSNLPEGFYNVCFSQPDPYLLTLYNPDASGGYEDRGHRVSASTYSIDNIYITAGETNLNADAGFYLPVNVNGYVFMNNDLNLVYDETDTALENITVNLLHENGTSLATQTDSNGHYEFTSVVPGTVTLSTTANSASLIDIPVQEPDSTAPMRNRAVPGTDNKACITLTVEPATTLSTMDSEPQNFGFSTEPLSTRIDIQVYETRQGIMIEITTVNENGNNDIEIYALIKKQWILTAVIPSEEIIGDGSNTYIVEASGLTVGKSYQFKIIDESGHVFETEKSIKVEKLKLKAIKTELTPESFTITFETDANSFYQVQYCTSLSDTNVNWKTEYVQVVHEALPGGISDYILSVQGAPEGTTTVRIPRSHKKAFYRIIEVDE